MSRSLALYLTVAPASRQTRARVRSVGTARDRNLPDRGQAARCCPLASRTAVHSHLASVIDNGSRKRSRMVVRKRCGFTVNSGEVGDPQRTKLAHGPECDLKWAWFAAHDWASTTVSRKWYSEEEDEQYCQPRCHSPGSTTVGRCGQMPRWRCLPTRTVDEPRSVQRPRCCLQISQTPRCSFNGKAFQDLACQVGKALLQHWEGIRPRGPICGWCQPLSRSEAQPTHPEGEARDVGEPSRSRNYRLGVSPTKTPLCAASLRRAPGHTLQTLTVELCATNGGNGVQRTEAGLATHIASLAHWASHNFCSSAKRRSMNEDTNSSPNK